MPKRKRILSSKPHLKKNQKITKQAPPGVEVASTNAEGSGARVCQSVQSWAATSYVPNAILKTNLRSTLSKLSAANSTIVDQDKRLSAMSKKTKDLTETVREAGRLRKKQGLLLQLQLEMQTLSSTTYKYSSPTSHMMSIYIITSPTCANPPKIKATV